MKPFVFLDHIVSDGNFEPRQIEKISDDALEPPRLLVHGLALLCHFRSPVGAVIPAR